MEVNQLNFTVEVLNQRGAAFDPIARIHINNIADGLDLRAMNMPANNAVYVVLPRCLHDSLLVVADVFDRRLGFIF